MKIAELIVKYNGTKIIGEVKYDAEKIAKIYEKLDAKRKAFADQMGLGLDEKLVLVTRNGFSHVNYKNKKINEKLDNTDIFDKDMQKDVQYIKDLVKKHYKDDATVIFNF